MIGIIGAMEPEVALLKSAIANPCVHTIGGFDFVSGTLEDKAVALLRCGIGKVNAAVGCAALITAYKPEVVLNTGSAGGIDTALRFGDAVISEGLVYHDVDVTAFDYAPGQVPGMPALFPVPENLIAQAEQAVDELKREGVLPETFHHLRGVIASGDVFMHESVRIAELRAAFPDVKAVEMEGAAVAHTCFLFKTPFLIIRALSDIAGTESPIAFKEFLPAASTYSAEIVRRFIRRYAA
ncbi:MAG: 5'-methylthioadenosine/S-adenosylhomocysteine nucleosidase [Spirochaetaceae bacterium]|jgi:adenosylhomocysteine nucleosidase|nr:5'-methylthioadenosine/S-adenosylhomocysteine nucleosidase [Spirochaetaceae bacterium]